MSRSPLFYPLNRGMDAEAGGAADLQTDVMRFMAILSLCLVAIFALVQSIPLVPTPSVEVRPDPVAVAAPQPARAAATPAPPEPLELQRPEPVKPPVREPQPVLQRPTAPAAERTEKSRPVAPVAKSQPPPAAPQGFTLRFEDDRALTRLVARNDVGLYAMLPEKSLRMSVNRGQVSFWPASLPGAFHEMDASTVPAAVLAAFAQTNGAPAGNLEWGVTLPAAMRRQLDAYLRDARGGALIIGADGALRLER